MTWPHKSVMVREVLVEMATGSGGLIFDATVGSGGHAKALAEVVGPEGIIIGCDRDESILKSARKRLGDGENIRLFHCPFSEIDAVMGTCRLEGVDGFLFDLGVSSLQLDQADRGFSFQKDGPLDMRMDTAGSQPTAAEVVNRRSEKELADIFFRFGEERHARGIARRIVAARKRHRIDTTVGLASIVAGCVSGLTGRIHPATRVFQALRIVVNDELGQLQQGLESARRWLVPGGRLVVISFHSLEDRIVKNFFRDDPGLEVLTRKPIRASESEKLENIRSRSAKLRAARRLGNHPGGEGDRQ